MRQDLGGIRFTPSVVILFFDDDGVVRKKAEGEEEIKMALRIGAFEKIIQDFIDQRMKLKLAEKFAEQLAGAMASDIARKRREAALEYEEKLRKEKAEKERKEREAKERELEEERRKRIEAEKKAEEAKANEQKAKLKSYAVDELMRMDLNNAKIRDIKDKMDDLGVSYAGCTSREDLIKKLTTNVPSLKSKLDQTDGGGGVRVRMNSSVIISVCLVLSLVSLFICTLFILSIHPIASLQLHSLQLFILPAVQWYPLFQ